MPKQIPVLDLLSKLSANSFLIDTRDESIVITPGILFGLPGKFFEYIDIVDTALKVMKNDERGTALVDIEEFKNTIAPKALDLNQYFTSLEKQIPNKDVLGLNSENKTQETEVPVTNEKEPSKTETTNQPKEKTSSKKSFKSYNGKRTYSYSKKANNGKTYNSYKKYSKKSDAK